MKEEEESVGYGSGEERGGGGGEEGGARRRVWAWEDWYGDCGGREERVCTSVEVVMKGRMEGVEI